MLTTEAQFQAAVARLAAAHQVLHYHTHDSRRSDAGFPDSVLLGRRLMLRELKLTRRSRVRTAQHQWLQALRNAGVDADIWYVEDYHSGLIDEQIRDLAVRGAARRARALPPLSLRLAKRLYTDHVGDPPGKAALLWESGVASVDHDTWIATAQRLLTMVSSELPHTAEEYTAWLSAHDLGHGAGIAAIFSALTSDLTARPTPGHLAAFGER